MELKAKLVYLPLPDQDNQSNLYIN